MRMRVIPCIDGTFRPSYGLGSCIGGSPGNLLVSIAIIHLFTPYFVLVRGDKKRKGRGLGTNIVV